MNYRATQCTSQREATAAALARLIAAKSWEQTRTSAILSALTAASVAPSVGMTALQRQRTLLDVLSTVGGTPAINVAQSPIAPAPPSTLRMIQALRSPRENPVPHQSTGKPSVEVIDLASLLARTPVSPTTSASSGVTHPNNSEEEEQLFAAQKGETFPMKLYRMLQESERAGLQDICGFSTSGKAFYIRNVPAFEETIMPRFFTSCRMASFQRQLNLYGFRFAIEGHDKGGYYHPYFVRGKTSLLRDIKRGRKGQRPITSGKGPVQDDVVEDTVPTTTEEKTAVALQMVQDLAKKNAPLSSMGVSVPLAPRPMHNEVSPIVYGFLQGMAAANLLKPSGSSGR